MKTLLFTFGLLTSSFFAFNQNLNIGDPYQGGIVAYLEPSGEFGFIAATSDQSTSAQWGCYGSSIPGANSLTIGAGDNNTTAIVSSCVDAGIAAKICDNLTLGGYSDWYLPSKDELSQLYQNKTAIGGFANDLYWSSSQDINNPTTAAWAVSFTDGTWGNWNKGSNVRVRAIRTFVPPPSASGSLTFCEGQSVTLTAPNGVSFLWNTGAISQSINVSSSGSYYVTVDTGTANFTTSESVVTVLNSPSIQTQPLNQTVLETQTATFFTYSPDSPLTYQWQTDLGVGFQDLSEVGQYSGTLSNTLDVSNCTISNNNQAFRCIIDNGQCQDTTDIVFINISGLGVNELLNSNNLNIYPNPVENEMFLQNVNQDDVIGIEILTPDGKMISQPKLSSSKLNIGGLPAGTYVIRLTTISSVLTARFIKQ